MEFEHFIITPFNLTNYPKVVYDYNRWLAWTVERIEMFKQYCLRSMINQSTTSYTWLLYVDSNTPESVRKNLPDLTLYPHMHYIFVNGFPQFMNQYMQDVREMCGAGIKWIITSRFDNDDCMHREAIATIQNCFKPRDEYMISLVSGYVHDLHSGRLSHYYYPNSPFISLVERVDKQDVKGIFYLLNHCAWPILKFRLFRELRQKSGSVTFVTHPVLWMQVFHEGNVSNSFYRGVPVVSKRDLTPFGIKGSSVASPLSKFFCYRNYHFWKMYMKLCVFRIKEKFTDKDKV